MELVKNYERWYARCNLDQPERKEKDIKALAELETEALMNGVELDYAVRQYTGHRYQPERVQIKGEPLHHIRFISKAVAWVSFSYGTNFVVYSEEGE